MAPDRYLYPAFVIVGGSPDPAALLLQGNGKLMRESVGLPKARPLPNARFGNKLNSKLSQGGKPTQPTLKLGLAVLAAAIFCAAETTASKGQTAGTIVTNPRAERRRPGRRRVLVGRKGVLRSGENRGSDASGPSGMGPRHAALYGADAVPPARELARQALRAARRRNPHTIVMERNRLKFFEAVQAFLDEATGS